MFSSTTSLHNKNIIVKCNADCLDYDHGLFYYFFALVTAMFGLRYLLGLKKNLHLNAVFFAYVLFLISIYFSPFFLRPPIEGLILDAEILIGLYLLLFFAISLRVSKVGRMLALPALSVLALFSFIYVDYLTEPFITSPKHYALNHTFKKGHVFTSFRTAFTLFKNTQHDEASLAFLDKKIERFANDF